MDQRNLRKLHRTHRLAVAGVCLALGVLTSLAVGCSAAGRHKILNVIFTGVPPLENEAENGSEKVTERELEAARQLRLEEAELALQPKFWAHGPYGAGQCDRCHAVAESKQFRASETDREDPFTSDVVATTSRLAAPPEILCISCHSRHSESFAQSRNLKLHIPEQPGRCITCHSPHQAQRRYMLLGSDNREMCSKCHPLSALEQITPHDDPTIQDCINCHNAHVGINGRLLKADQHEIELIYGEG